MKSWQEIKNFDQSEIRQPSSWILHGYLIAITTLYTCVIITTNHHKRGRCGQMLGWFGNFGPSWGMMSAYTWL